MPLGDVLARLSVELGLDTAAFTTGSRKAQRANKDLGDSAEAMGRRIGGATKAIAIAGAAVAGAFVLGQLKELVKGGLEYAGSLGETAQQLGVTTKALQEFRYAASQQGVAQEEIDKGLQKLTKTAGLAAGGNKAAGKAFADLGVDIRDSNGHVKDAGELIPLVAEALSKLPDAASRAASEVALFGKTGQQLDPLLSLGAKGVKGLTDAAQQLGIVLSDDLIHKADDASDKLSALEQVLKAKVSVEVAENATSILELVNALIKLVEYAGKGARAWKEFRAGFSGSQFLGDLGQAGLGSAIINQIGNAQRAATAPSVQLTFSPAELAARRSASGGGVTAVPQFLRRPGAKSGTYTPGFGPTKFAEGGIDIQAGRNTAALAAFTQVAATAEAAAGRMIPVLAKLDAATATTRESFDKLSPAVQSLFERLFPQEAANRDYEVALGELRKELDRGTISFDRFEEARRRLSALSLGGDPNTPVGESVFENADAIVPDLDKIDHALGKLKGFSDTTADGVEIANVRVVRSFADTAQNVLGSLQNLSSAIQGGGFLNILSAVIGLGVQLGGIGAFGKSIQTNLNSGAGSGSGRVRGFASGTGFAPGGLALVGERGPELVGLPRGSRVWPNGQGPNGNGQGGGGSEIRVIPSPYFTVVVDGRVVSAAPSIMDGAARVAASRGARAQSRRLA